MEYTQDRLNAEIRELRRQLESLQQSDKERLMTEITLVVFGVFAGFWFGYMLGAYQ